MRRFLIYLLLLTIVGYGLWPYYTVNQLDSALLASDPQGLAPYVDLDAIKQNYNQRLGQGVGAFTPRDQSDSERVLAWLAQNLQSLGEAALDQAITPEWVRNTINDANAKSTEQRPAKLFGAIDFAFFESWNRFVIRIGKLGNDTHVVLGLQWPDWKVPDWKVPGWKVVDVVR